LIISREWDESNVPESPRLMEFWQAEWCPHSHRVRLRLTELGISYVARQVPADRDDRHLLEAETGGRSIPTLVDGDTIVSGADAILEHLEATTEEPAGARAHRAKMREEWPHWLEQHSAFAE
jgi:glutathione S-transferase